MKCPYLDYVVCHYDDCVGCLNYKPTPETKEEWVDCTLEYCPEASRAWRIHSDNTVMYWKGGAEGLFWLPTVHDNPRFRVYTEGAAFRIERRVVKKVCKECGREA